MRCPTFGSAGVTRELTAQLQLLNLTDHLEGFTISKVYQEADNAIAAASLDSLLAHTLNSYFTRSIAPKLWGQFKLQYNRHNFLSREDRAGWLKVENQNVAFN